MHLTDIHITNYQRIKELHLTGLKPATVLTGNNGCGKSTILRAVAHAISGKLFDHRGKSIPNRHGIGPAGDTATVQLVFQHEGKRVKHRFTIRPATISLAFEPRNGDLFQSIGVLRDHAEIALHPARALYTDEFASALGKDGRALLAPELVEELLGARKQEVQAWTLETLHRDWEETAGSLLAIGDAAYAIRRENNRMLKECEADLLRITAGDAPMDAQGNEVTMNMLPAIVKRVGALVAERDQAIRSLGAAAAVAQQQAELNALLGDLGPCPPAPDQELLRKADQAYANATGKQESLRQEADSIRRRLKVSGPCPTCGQVLTEAARADIEARAVALDNERAALPVAELLAGLTDARAAYAAAERARAAWNGKDDRIKRLQSAIGTASASVTEDQIAELDTRIGRGNALAAAVKAANHRSELLARQAELERRNELLNWMCERLRDPQRLVSKGGNAATFIAAANTVLAEYGAALTMDQCLQFRQGSRDWTPVESCSEGEQWVIQAAVCAGYAPGCLAIIDRMECLDGGLRGIALQMMATGGWLVAASHQFDMVPDSEALRAMWAPLHPVWIDDEVCG